MGGLFFEFGAVRTESITQADARAYLALVEVDNRRLKREAKEKEDTAKFEAAKRDAVKRKRREAYAEAAGLMTTRAVKTLTKMRAKNVVEEMRAGLTPISFFIKKPGPPPEVGSCVHAIDATPARWRGVVVYGRSFLMFRV